MVNSPQENYEGAQMGKDLVAKMVQDKDFMQGVKRGLRDIDQGRYSSIEVVKRRLGDLECRSV